MSAHVKIKKIKMSVGMKDEGLADMFNQMLGTRSVNLNIAYPRYLRIKHLCEQLVKLFELLASSPFMKSCAEFAPQKIELDTFCKEGREKIGELFKIDLADYTWNLDIVEEELKIKFAEAYEQVKKSNLVNTFIKMCDNLVAYKKNFIDLDKLSHKFITTMPGIEWKPIPFSSLNIKYVFSLATTGENTMRVFMTILSKAFELSHRLYEELQSPDIDVDLFVDIIMSNMDKIQCHPELNRCGKAFQKIKDSVSMLKVRFNNYYRDFIATKDSTIMMQHFVLDVSKNTSTDPMVTAQFRTMIGYYRKLAQNQITDPKVKMLFDKVGEQFKELDRDKENLVNIRKSEEEGEEGGLDAVEDSDPIMLAPVAKTMSELTNATAALKTTD